MSEENKPNPNVPCPCGSKKAFAECHGDRPPLHGWKEIAAALGVTERAAQRFATRNRLPLVVYLDAAARVWCPWSHVRDFKNLHHLPLHLRAQISKRKTKRRAALAKKKGAGVAGADDGVPAVEG
jgi:hypothetical protein